MVGVAGGSQRQRGLAGEAQRAVPLDGELGRVAAELLVVLDDVGVGRRDAGGVVDVVVLDVLAGAGLQLVVGLPARMEQLTKTNRQ